MQGDNMEQKGQAYNSIKLELQQNLMIICFKDWNIYEKYRGEYSYDILPIQFRVLFENLSEFYQFLAEETERRVKIDKGVLRISVNIIGKIKEFLLPLQKMELTYEEQLQREVRQIRLKLEESKGQMEGLRASLREKQSIIEEKENKIISLITVTREKESQNLKLMNRIRNIQNHMEDLMLEKNNGCQNIFRQSRLTEEFTPVKKVSSNSKSKRANELQEFGRKINIRLDQNCKHFHKFKIRSNEVEKLHGPTYQLHNYQSIPREGKYYFDVKIVLIKNNNIVVGIITDKNKEEQFSFKKSNCICYNGYDGSICEQDKQNYVNIKPKEGNKIRTVVNLNKFTVEWFLMGQDSPKCPIGTATIPLSMAKQNLYPYFELYWQGNKIKLNS